MKIKRTNEFKELSIEDTFKLLESSPEGLSETEASERLKEFGFNEVPEKKKNPVLEFLLNFWGPMPWLLEFTIVLSYFTGHLIEAILISILLIINSIVRHLHSSESKKVLELLKKKLAISAKVLRNGKWVTKEAREIVPGDIIIVGLGDIVPADAKIIEGELSVDQSALTGESLPVNVSKSDIIYSGSIVKRGKAKCIVVNTGINTYFGKTTELVKVAKSKSHQEEVVMSVMRYMLHISIIAYIVVVLYALFKGGIGAIEILNLAVVFLMASVPVALPAVLTIAQSVGALELAKKNALVTRLSSVEDAASIDVLCFDKTGTITQNKLSVTSVYPIGNYNEKEVILAASLASDEESKDQIDIAILEYARKIGISTNSYRRVSYTPFEPSIKRSEAIVECNGKQIKVMKGEPNTIMSLCNDDNIKKEVESVIEEMSKKGYRSLAIARKELNDSNSCNILGIISLSDPPRPDSKVLIEEIKNLGIKPIMLTGDNYAIAKQIAQELSIGSNIITLRELKNLSQDEQQKKIEQCDGIAEIYPEDKYNVVRLLQERGHFVGMTGDGVNDAPALKQAEMGIAVYNSTDVAKASASVVLTSPGLGAIVDTIKVSREVHERMRTWVLNKITKTVTIVSFLTVMFLWLKNLLITPLDMAILLFTNDFITMTISTDNVKYSILPSRWNMRNITLESTIIGLLHMFEVIILIFFGINYFNLPLEKLRTFTLLLLILESQYRIFIVRERKFFWSSRPSNSMLLVSIVTAIGFFLFCVFGRIIPPITFLEGLFVFVYTVPFIFLIDFVKYISIRKFNL